MTLLVMICQILDLMRMVIKAAPLPTHVSRFNAMGCPRIIRGDGEVSKARKEGFYA